METPSNIHWKSRSAGNGIQLNWNMENAKPAAVQSFLELGLLGFPEKLWNLVNSSEREEIVWAEDGVCIVIPNTQQFISNILDNPSKQIFKTKNFSSFVRQLNLYGFRKVTEHRGKGAQVDGNSASTKCKFKHPSFQMGRRDLLPKVKRQYQSAKKDESEPMKSSAQPSAPRESNAFPPWSPAAAFFPPTPFFPLFAPQMPMPPFPPVGTFQFPEMLYGGLRGYPKELNTMGLPCQWDYSPYASMPPFVPSPLALEQTREPAPLGNDIQNNTQDISFSAVPDPKTQTPQRPTVLIINNTLPQSRGTSPRVSLHDKQSNGAATNLWPGPPETKQPLPAQNSTAELSKAAAQAQVSKRGCEETGEEKTKAASRMKGEEFRCKKAKFPVQEEKCSVFPVPVPSASSVSIELNQHEDHGRFSVVLR